jgi:hypothetical protein
MKRDLLMVIGIALAASSTAHAQTTPAAPSEQVAPAAPAKQAAATTSMRQQLSDNLTKAGYTDVKVMPEAFIIKANNKAGEPVIMFLSPDSMTVFTAKDPKGQDAKTAPTAAQ